MVMRCQDIIKLTSLKRIKLVAGEGGVDRIVRWPYVVQTELIDEWVHGGELLFVTGLGIKTDEDNLLALVKEGEAKKLAGIVILIGNYYIKEIPEKLIDLANTLNFPVFELPWEVKLVEVTEDICSYIVMKQMEEKSIRDLLENILFSDFDSPETLISRAAYFRYNLTTAHQVAVIDIDNFSYFLREKGLTDERKILELKTHFQQLVHGVLSKYNKKILSMLRSDSIILLMPIENKTDEEKVTKILDDIRSSIYKELSELTVSIGLGRCYQELKDLKKSFQEAEKALKVIKVTNSKNRIYNYKDLGIYRVLFEVGDLKELEHFYLETLGLLLEYDRCNNTEFMKTLEIYLEENCNLVKTAQRIFIHRNSMIYRIHRIEEITGRSLADAYQRLEFQNGLMIGRFLDIAR